MRWAVHRQSGQPQPSPRPSRRHRPPSLIFPPISAPSGTACRITLRCQNHIGPTAAGHGPRRRVRPPTQTGAGIRHDRVAAARRRPCSARHRRRPVRLTLPRIAGSARAYLPMRHVASVPASVGIHGTIVSVPWTFIRTEVSPECALMPRGVWPVRPHRYPLVARRLSITVAVGNSDREGQP